MSRAATTTTHLRRRSSEGRSYYSIGIPTEMSTVAALLEGRMFTCELTDDGLLFRPLPVPPASDDLPTWVGAES